MKLTQSQLKQIIKEELSQQMMLPVAEVVTDVPQKRKEDLQQVVRKINSKCAGEGLKYPAYSAMVAYVNKMVTEKDLVPS